MTATMKSTFSGSGTGLSPGRSPPTRRTPRGKLSSGMSRNHAGKVTPPVFGRSFIASSRLKPISCGDRLVVTHAGDLDPTGDLFADLERLHEAHSNRPFWRGR